MLKGQQDKAAVSQATLATGQSLCMWVFSQRGIAYILGDEHYKRLELGGAVWTGEPFPEYEDGGVKCFIAARQKEKDCRGFIPATRAALDEITAAGMREVQEGLRTSNVMYLKDGTKMSVYR